jgi:hypothetical protein
MDITEMFSYRITTVATYITTIAAQLLGRRQGGSSRHHNASVDRTIINNDE